MENEVKLAAEKIGGKREEQEERQRRRTLLIGCESQAKGELSRKRHTRRMETENQKTERRKAKDGTGTRIIKTGILEDSITRVLRRYGISTTKEWNDKNFKDENWET